MLGANASDFTVLLFVLLIVTMFASVLVKISNVLSGLPLTISPQALLLLMCSFTKCEVYQEQKYDIITEMTSFEFQNHS